MEEKNLHIRIKGASQNNLKSIDIELPHHQLIGVTGVSGSGKSSLAFDIIANEGKRQYLSSIPSFARQFSGKINPPQVASITGLFPVITVSQKVYGNSSKSTVGTLSEIYDWLRLLYARFGQSPNPIDLTRGLFSFNNQLGACPHCNGLGIEEQISLDKLIADPSKTLREGALVPTLPNGYIMYSQVTVDVLNTVCQQHGFSVDIPWNELSEDQKNVILNGSDRIKVLFGKHSLESRLKWTGLKAKPREEGYYKGMLPIMQDILKRDRNKNILRFVSSVTCTSCHGKRLNKDALSVTYRSKTIDELCDLELNELLQFVQKIKCDNEAELKIIKKLSHQLQLLGDLGCGYLQLSRPAPSLTGGELQRIKLVNQLSAQLSNVLYVFDEPSIGLHPKDQSAMLSILQQLVRNGNTVILVEHNPDIIRQTNWIIEIGPEAGINGGNLIYNGPTDNFLNAAHNNLTATQKALMDSERRSTAPKTTDFFPLFNCKVNNLKAIDVRFQTKAINVVTGVNGAGKASLVNHCLLPELDNYIVIDQKPIGRTPRSNPATYTGLSDHIRDLFAALPAAKEAGFKKSRFSFNNKGGRCETCEGSGKIVLGMHYMGNVELECATCNGKRFNATTLAITFNEKNIAEIYQLSINEAVAFFKGHPKLVRFLEILQELGLGYLKLGQSSTTLSGGEAQRIKLATSLAKKPKSNSWYILHEPTIGLHYQDIQLLIHALEQLTKQGHTIVCIEHNKQLIKAADWVIDLGPGSGKQGGEVLFQGNPETLPSCQQSVTAQYLENKTIKNSTPQQKTQPETTNSITIKNCTTNNLKGVDVSFPKNQVSVITGLSGSGKSSLAFDTLFAEAQSKFSESLSTYARSFIQQSNQAKVDTIDHLTPIIAINRKNLSQSPRSTVGTISGIYEKYRFLFSRVAQLNGEQLTASNFSFNHESGACESCSGIGFQLKADIDKLVPKPSLSILDGALTHNKAIQYYGNPDGQFVAILKEVAEAYQIDLTLPVQQFSQEHLALIFYGTGDKIWETTWEFKSKTRTGKQEVKSTWKGFCVLIDEEYTLRQNNKKIEALTELLSESTCSACSGSRLSSRARSVELYGLSIAQLSALSVDDTLKWFASINPMEAESKLIENIFPHISPLLQHLKLLGLGHLSIDRTSSTLSGGEGQRLRLAQQLSNGLVGVTYILDEPSLGLHHQDILPLINIIQQLKEMGNTLIIVEHHKELIKAADYIVEMGPGSGKNGGQVTFQGTYNTFMTSNSALHLNEKNYPAPSPVDTPTSAFGLKQVSLYNLNNVDFDFKSHQIIALTGVSGSGKSTLMHQVLYPTLKKQKTVHCQSFYDHAQFDEILAIDQKVLQATATSTLASFTGMLDLLKTLFADLPQAKEAGFKKNAFSYLHKDGRCNHCNGSGQLKISMDFIEDVWNICEKCQGNRYNSDILAVQFNKHSIADVLTLSVSESIELFVDHTQKNTKKLMDILLSLKEIGLGHLQLGQNVISLSGGESQRLKLITQLIHSTSKNTLFLLDEPSSGLHYKDIDLLIQLFQQMIQKGHTILFIEHNPYLISIANQTVLLS